MTMFSHIFKILIFCIVSNATAQKKCNLFSWNIKAKNYLHEASTPSVEQYLDSLNIEGYYSINIDSITYENNNCKVFINKGLKYEDYLYTDLKEIEDSLISNGLLFNKITITPNGFENSKSLYDISINKGLVRKINNLKYIGFDKIPLGYSKQLINESPLANNKEILKIESVIKDSRFIRLKYPSKLSFTKDSTTLFLYTEKIKNNHFDGLIGLSTNRDGEIRINGQINLQLSNLFNHFDLINLNWSSSKSHSQDLSISIDIPYLVYNKLGINTDLQIRKQDSSYIQLGWLNGMSYPISSTQRIGAYFNLEKSNYAKQNLFAESYNKYGFGVQYLCFKDNTLFQNNKFLVDIKTGLLNKSSSKEVRKQVELKFLIEKQHKIWKNHYINLKLQGENLFQKNNTFLLNEMFRIGGANNLRGFNQNSIFGNRYNIGSIAYRYIPNDDFLLEVFSDNAYIENNEIHTILYGMGVGFQFRSEIGIFKLAYALGKPNEQSFDFENSKVHFGIETFF